MGCSGRQKSHQDFKISNQIFAKSNTIWSIHVLYRISSIRISEWKSTKFVRIPRGWGSSNWKKLKVGNIKRE